MKKKKCCITVHFDRMIRSPAAAPTILQSSVGLLLKKERKNSKPIRSYMKTIQKIQHEEGTAVSTKKMLQQEFKYAAHLHDILKVPLQL